MKIQRVKTKVICIMLCLFLCTVQMGCRKLIEIDAPINTLTSGEIFSTDATATSAMAGIYSTMINGTIAGSAQTSVGNVFSAGLSTTLGAMSSDELYYFSTNSYIEYRSNRLNVLNSGYSNFIWTSAYDIIYKSNSVIEGITASKSAALHNNVRTELIAEAKFIRAFCYFYLTNFFGDVPMVLTVDFNKTQNLTRMPRQQVYQQIIADLKDARADLQADYSAGNGERIIPNKWAATLLLARAYLYNGDYADAAAGATAIIDNSALFDLEPDLKNVFSATSREAVWQLKQTTTDAGLKNATPEGLQFGGGYFCLTDELLSAFENDDQRRIKWVDTINHANNPSLPRNTTFYRPNKYIVTPFNADFNPPSQYYMVLRLAEAYLIRAEAEANGANGGAAAAIADLNVIRNRAGLQALDNSLSPQSLKIALAKERQSEFFAEWGHRWFDLKRTGQAHNVLSIVPAKQPWTGDYQLLYPIPRSEITFDHFLKQNPGY